MCAIIIKKMALTDVNRNTLLDDDGDDKTKLLEEEAEDVATKVLDPLETEKTTKPEKPFKPEIVWVKAIFIFVIHFLALYGIAHAHLVKLQTFHFSFFIGLLGGIGVQVGAHRLWSHRSFKATYGLRVFLAACQTMAGQKTIYFWVRDHRVHHKYSETTADPHDSNRGFWFAHLGWIYIRKHPDVLKKGAQLNLRDIEADPIVMFQKRHYLPLLILFWGIIPTVIPVYFWGENVWLAILACVFFRHVYMLNVTGLVNSYAHMFGHRPYDTRIAPAESTFMRHLMMGEGFHNYHHAFPWDYSTSELGPLDVFNPATAFIDVAHWCGWAYDLKKPSREMVESKMRSTGNVSIAYSKKRMISRTLWEWIVGLSLVLLPWFTIRWILMAMFNN